MNKFIFGVAAAALMITSSANAAFVMILDDSSTAEIDAIVQDDTLAGVLTGIGFVTTTSDSILGAGVVNYTGGFGSFLVNVTTGVSKPLISSSGTMLDLNSINVSGGTGSLLIGLTDTDFLRDGGAGFLNFKIGGVTDGTVEAAAYMDTANAEFGDSTELGYMSAASSAFSYTSGGTTVNTLDPYSLTLLALITHENAGDATSFNASVVPEPSMIALMSLGFIGLGFAGRRKQAK